MALYEDQDYGFSEATETEEEQLEECSHPSVHSGVCEDCYCQVTEFDTRPKFSVGGNKRISSVDYVEGNNTTSVHGVVKTFQERANLSHYPISIVKQVCGLYDKVADNSVMRGSQRLGVIAACLEQVQLQMGVFIGEKKILKLFDIRKRDLSNGQTLLSGKITLRFPEISDIIRSSCKLIGLHNQLAVAQAIEFGNLMKSTDPAFNKSTVNTTGAAFLYTFIELKPEVRELLTKKREFTLQSFATSVDLSKSTIKELYQKAREVIEDASH